MTKTTTVDLEINGAPPEIAGRVCEGFVCEGYTYRGEPISTANVTYLRFGGTWHRLYFEPYLIFWRPFGEEPNPWEVQEQSWDYPHTNIGQLAGVQGQVLDSYEMSPTPEGSKVVFYFHNGRIVEIEDKTDVASYTVI